MLSLTEQFTAFLQNIQPNEERAGLARDLPAKVREFLEDSEEITTVYPHSRLSGSYARNTAIKEIKDVDILLFVDPAYKDGEDSAQNVINKLVSALVGFPDALGDENGYIESEPAIKRQRRSHTQAGFRQAHGTLLPVSLYSIAWLYISISLFL